MWEPIPLDLLGLQMRWALKLTAQTLFRVVLRNAPQKVVPFPFPGYRKSGTAPG